MLCRCARASCRNVVSRALLPCRNTKAAPPFAIQKLYRDIERMPRARWAVSRKLRAIIAHTATHVAAPYAVSWRAAALYHSTVSLSLCHDMKHRITTHLASQAARHTLLPPLPCARADRVVGAVSQGYWPYCGPPVARPLHACVMIQPIVS